MPVLVEAADVPGAEPSVAGEGGSGVLGPLPVLEEHGRAPNLDLTGLPFGHGAAFVVDETCLDPGQGSPHRTRDAPSSIRVGERHADLRHPVPLQEGVPGQLLPPLEDGNRQCRRTGHHQPEATRPFLHPGTLLFGATVEMGDQTVVDGGHRHIQGEVTGGETVCHLFGVEGAQDVTACPRPEGAPDDVDDPVDVMEGQREQDPVVRGPVPRLDQRRDLGLDAGMGADHPFRLSGGATGEEDHRSARAIHPGQRDRLGNHLPFEHEVDAPFLGQGPEQGGVSGGGHHAAGCGHIERMLQLWCRMGDSERDRNPTRAPDRPLGADIAIGGLDHEGHPGLIQVRRAREEMGSSLFRTGEQGGVGVAPLLIADGDTVSPRTRAIDDRQTLGHRLILLDAAMQGTGVITRSWSRG